MSEFNNETYKALVEDLMSGVSEKGISAIRKKHGNIIVQKILF